MIYFRALKEADIDTSYLETLNDKAYMMFSRQKMYFHTSLSQKRYLDSYSNSEISIIKAACESDSHDLIGVVNATEINRSISSCNAGILIFRSFGHKGKGHEVWQSWLEFLHTTERIKIVYAGTHIGNISMQKLCLKAQMKQIQPVQIEVTNDLVFFEHIDESFKP